MWGMGKKIFVTNEKKMVFFLPDTYDQAFSIFRNNNLSTNA